MNDRPAISSGCPGHIHDIVDMSAVRDYYNQFIIKLCLRHLFIHLPLVCHVGKRSSSGHAFERNCHHNAIPGYIDHKLFLCFFKKAGNLFSGDNSCDQSFLHGFQAQSAELILCCRSSPQHCNDRSDIFSLIEHH